MFELIDLTYYTQNKNITPKRVRTTGGVFRRIFSVIERNIKNDNVWITQSVLSQPEKKQIEEKLGSYHLKM